MGGRGSLSMTAADGLMPGAGKTRYDLQMISGRKVIDVINEAVENGAIIYQKPLKRFLTNEEEGKDLFAHAALYLDGWKFEVPMERNSENSSKEEWAKYRKSIDIIRTDNGEYWEIKSPPAGGEWNNTRAVERGFINAIAQFEGHPVAHSRPRRVVFNGRHLNASDDEISKRIDKEMRLHGIHEVVQVRKDGSLQYHPPRT